MTSRLFFTLLLAVLSAGSLANPCALGGRPFPAEEGTGMGGTGVKTGDGMGTGGTGHRDGTGSGGTGQQARAGDGSGTGGTGVVGIITGFGSVCVNGLEIHYDAATPVLANGARASAGELAVGQMAVVEAVGQGANLIARQIHVQHALIGRVQEVDGAQVKVWGQWVNLPGAQGLKAGARIKVSGYRLNANSIFATRIDAALPQEADLVSGEVEAVENGTALINGVSVRLPAGSAALRPGKEIRAMGKADGEAFKASRIEAGGMPDFLDKMDRLVMQDSVRPGKGGKVRVGGVEFAMGARTQVKGGGAKDLQPGRVVRIEAARKDGRMVIERIDLRTEQRERMQREKETASPDGASEGADKEASDREERHPSENRDNESREDRERDNAEKPAARSEERTERREGYERAEKRESAERSERYERSEVGEKPDRLERIEKLERPERAEKIEKPEKAERPERAEKPEKPERPERQERPERDD